MSGSARGIQRERDLRGILEVQLKRFWSKVDRRGADECWPWLANKTAAGYGHVRIDKRGYMAHRVVYELEVEFIPEGYVIDHLCENPSCVNPAHLEAVSNATNAERHHGQRTLCKYGHPLDAWMRNGGRIRRYCRTCENARQRRRYRRKHPHVS